LFDKMELFFRTRFCSNQVIYTDKTDFYNSYGFVAKGNFSAIKEKNK